MWLSDAVLELCVCGLADRSAARSSKGIGRPHQPCTRRRDSAAAFGFQSTIHIPQSESIPLRNSPPGSAVFQSNSFHSPVYNPDKFLPHLRLPYESACRFKWHADFVVSGRNASNPLLVIRSSIFDRFLPVPEAPFPAARQHRLPDWHPPSFSADRRGPPVPGFLL